LLAGTVLILHWQPVLLDPPVTADWLLVIITRRKMQEFLNGIFTIVG